MKCYVKNVCEILGIKMVNEIIFLCKNAGFEMKNRVNESLLCIESMSRVYETPFMNLYESRR